MAEGESVLVVDDEADLRNLVVMKLKEAGFVAEGAPNAAQALAAAARLRPVVVVLDLMLPDRPGTEVCKALRADPLLRDAGVLMLTAKGEEVDRVLGLELGADDYVVKPFSVRELVARVRALARRVGDRRAPKPEAPDMLRWKGLEVDARAHRVTADGEELVLTPLEFRLLSMFLAQPGRAFTRDQLLDSVWNISADVTTRTVDTHVKRLREKLGAYGDIIETVRGVGYRLREP
jgi:two-component system phosphate regulon response regulator PhoB